MAIRSVPQRFLVLTVLAAMAIVVCAAGVRAAAAQRTARAQAQPPVSMTCPMHPDVVESRPGNCPLCRMALVPVRLASAWSCPLHPAVLRGEAGTCPICRRPLNRVTVSLTWTCPADPKVDALGRVRGLAARDRGRGGPGDREPREAGRTLTPGRRARGKSC